MPAFSWYPTTARVRQSGPPAFVLLPSSSAWLQGLRPTASCNVNQIKLRCDTTAVLCQNSTCQSKLTETYQKRTRLLPTSVISKASWYQRKHQRKQYDRLHIRISKYMDKSPLTRHRAKCQYCHCASGTAHYRLGT